MRPDFSLAAALALPVAFACLALAAGLVARRVLGKRLESVHAGGRHTTAALILSAVRGSIVVWCTVLGLFLAAKVAELPPGVARVVPNVMLVVLIASLTWALARVAAGLVRRVAFGVQEGAPGGAEAGSLPSASLIANVTRLAILALGLLVILQTLGISITPVITALGVGGLAVALALQDTLANLFAGVHLLASRQLRPGDFLKLDSGQEGCVQDITWRYTSIREVPNNNLVVVPNAKLASAITTNFSRPDNRVSFAVLAGVSYDTDLGRAERLALDVAREVQKDVAEAVHDFEPEVSFLSFGMRRVMFEVVLQAREAVAVGPVRHQLVKRLHQRFRAAGIAMSDGWDTSKGRLGGTALAQQLREGVDR